MIKTGAGSGESTESRQTPMPREDLSTSAFGYGRFKLWWSGSFIAMTGLRLNQIALVILVFDLTGSAMKLGILAGATAGLTIVLTLFGGMLADRFNTRVVLSFSAAAIGGNLVVVAVLVLTGVVQIWHVYLLAAVNGLALGVDQPARPAYFTSLVPRTAMRSAVTLNGILLAGNAVLIPTLGGFVIAAFGVEYPFFFAGGCWGIMLIVLAFLPARRVRQNNAGNPLRDLADGIGFVRTHRLFAAVIGLAFVSMFFGSGWIQILPAYVDQFAGESREVGYVFSAAGSGAFCGILLSGRMNRHKHYGKLVLGACLLFSSSLILVALAPALKIALFAALLAHLGNGFFPIGTASILQVRVPEALRGRVMGIYSIISSLFVLGGLFTGSMAGLFGIRHGMLVGPAIVISAALIVAATQPVFRNLDDASS